MLQPRHTSIARVIFIALTVSTKKNINMVNKKKNRHLKRFNLQNEL